MADNSQISDMSSTELAEKYQNIDNEYATTETEKQWKLDNASTIAPNEKCALVYRERYVMGARITELENAGIDVSVLRSAQEEMDEYLEKPGSGPSARSQGTKVAAGTLSAKKAIIFQACGFSEADLDALFDKAWTEQRAKNIMAAIQDDLNKAGTEAKTEALRCAQDLLNNKTEINRIIEQFWRDTTDPNVGMFPSTYDAMGLRKSPTIPPAIEDPNETVEARAANAQIAAENVNTDINLFVEEDPVSAGDPLFDPAAGYQIPEPADQEEVAAIVAEVTGEVAVNTKTHSANQPYPNYMLSSTPRYYYWDHILISADARKNLKVQEYMGDITGVLQGPAEGFPHLYASLAIGLANSVEALLSKMPSEGEVKNFEAGTSDSSAALFNSVSEVSVSLNTKDETLTPNNYDLGGLTPTDVIGFLKTAAARIPRFMPGEPSEKTRDWLTNAFADTLQRALNTAAENAQCIKDAKDKFDEQLQKIKDAIPEIDVDDGFWPWNNDDEVEKILNQAAANMSDPELASFGFGTPAQKALFKEQCFLLAFAAKLAAYKRNTLDSAAGSTSLRAEGIHKRLPYTSLPDIKQDKFSAKSQFNSSLQISGDPFAFINRLTQAPNYSNFVDIPHYQLSALQPRIRLYKVEYDTKDENDNEVLETEVEMKFNSAFTADELDDVFKNKRSRSAGVGLQDFEFTYDGSNPFAVKKSIKATLRLYSSTFAQLFKERKGETKKIGNDGRLEKGPDANYRYIDLALKTLLKDPGEFTKTEEYQRLLDENVGLSKLNFRLKAVVGWSMPKGKIPGMSATERKKLKNVLSNSYVTLNLTPTIHTFNFDQTGAVTFEINYLAYIDDFFDDRGFNIFADPTGKVGWARELRKLGMKTYRQRCSSAEEITSLNEKYKDVVTEETNRSLASLLSSMMDNNKIFYIALDYNKIQNFVASGPYNTYESYIINKTGEIVKSDTQRDERLAEQVQTALEAATASGQTGEDITQLEHQEAIAAALYAAGPTSNELGFFYLSDLIDVILENIQLELDYLEAQYSNPNSKKDKTTEFPQENPDKIDVKLWEKRTKDLQKFKNNFRRFRVLLGPIELIHHKKTDSKYVESVNLGDIPISVKYFMEWVTGKVFQKDEVFYSLSTFLNQIMNNLVTNFLNNRKCFYFDIKQKVRVNQAAITSYSPSENSSNNVHIDEVTALMLKKAKLMKKKRSGQVGYTGSPTRLNFSDAIVKDYMGFNADNTFKTDREGNIIGARPLLNVSGRPNEDGSNYAPLSHEINYMTFYASRVAATGAPNREKDLKKGIFHYLLGQENGILKEIKLQKTQTKGLAEARFEMDGYDGLEQLRVVYDLDIQTYANVNAFPGTYIYVPPGGLDPSWRRYNFTDTNLRSLGIGGYYMIIRSTHSFAAGQANSTIYAKWVNSLESDYPPSEGGSPASEEAEESKCSAASTARLQELERP